MARGVKSGIITTDGVKEENVPNEGTNKGNDNVIVSPGIPNDGKGMPPTGEEEIKPEGQQTIDQGAGAIIKEDNFPEDRANVEAPLDLTNEETHDGDMTEVIEPEKDKVIVHSDGNLYWDTVGRLEMGYNLVSKEAAEKWLTHKKVRKASAQEVKEHFAR